MRGGAGQTTGHGGKFGRLARRLERLEHATTIQLGMVVRYARLRPLTRSYVGERHKVLLKGEPSPTTETDCEVEERTGRGPELRLRQADDAYLSDTVTSACDDGYLQSARGGVRALRAGLNR
jgi:hypothetical protein